MVPALTNLVHVAGLVHQGLGGVGLVAVRDRDLCVVKDWLFQNTHLLSCVV